MNEHHWNIALVILSLLTLVLTLTLTLLQRCRPISSERAEIEPRTCVTGILPLLACFSVATLLPTQQDQSIMAGGGLFGSRHF